MAHTYRVISGDAHLEIPPDLWTHRVPAHWRGPAPRIAKLPGGAAAAVMEGRNPYIAGLALGAKPYEQHSIRGEAYADNPGTGGPEQRLREQDLDGVDAEVLFPSSSHQSFWRGIRDDDGYKALIHAFNEFLAEEYC